MTELEVKYFNSAIKTRLEFTIAFFKQYAGTDTEKNAGSGNKIPAWIRNGFGFDLLISAGVQVCTEAEKKQVWERIKHVSGGFPKTELKDALLFVFFAVPGNGFASLAELLEGKKQEIITNELARIGSEQKAREGRELAAELLACLDSPLPKEGIGFEAEKRLLKALKSVGVEISATDGKELFKSLKNDEKHYAREVSFKLWNSAPKEKREAAAEKMKKGEC